MGESLKFNYYYGIVTEQFSFYRVPRLLIKDDKEHEHELTMYENTKADLKILLAEGEKIPPKAWMREREQLEKEMPALRNERAWACHDLAFAEVNSYNRSNLERVEQNESRQHNRQLGRIKGGRKKLNEFCCK